AGPRRPQDRVPLTDVRRSFERELDVMLRASAGRGSARAAGAAVEAAPVAAAVEVIGAGGATYSLTHGSVVIAAITSCTNTSNPAVMIAAGLLAKKAVEFGLEPRPW